jgi:hypothetical protein
VSEEAAPKELVVDAKPAPGDQSSTSGTAMTPLVLPAVVAALLAKAVSPAMGLVGLGVGVVVLLVLRKPDAGRFVLRVEAGALEIAREKAKDAPLRFALDDLLDVGLDKEIRPASGGRGGGPSERVRLVLERAAPSGATHADRGERVAREGPRLSPEARLDPEGRAARGRRQLASVTRVARDRHAWPRIPPRRRRGACSTAEVARPTDPSSSLARALSKVELALHDGRKQLARDDRLHLALLALVLASSGWQCADRRRNAAAAPLPF